VCFLVGKLEGKTTLKTLEMIGDFEMDWRSVEWIVLGIWTNSGLF
jgi:hypothetical protein